MPPVNLASILLLVTCRKASRRRPAKHSPTSKLCWLKLALVEDVVKTTIFLADMAHFAAVNSLYAQVFQHEPPARSTVQVAALPKGGLVEIEMIALLDD